MNVFLSPSLRGAGDAQREDAVGVPVAVAGIGVSAAVARGPHEDGALALPAARHAVDEGPPREGPRTVHGLAVVLRAPGGAVYVDVFRIQAQGPRLHRVVHDTVQHAHT